MTVGGIFDVWTDASGVRVVTKRQKEGSDVACCYCGQGKRIVEGPRETQQRASDERDDTEYG
jgi:hypothetical protein